MMQTFLLGLVCVLAPGPVMIETIRRSVRGGIRGGAAVQSGAFSGNLLYALLFISGVGQLLVFPGLKFSMGMLGAGLLLYLGISMVRDRRSISQMIDATHMHSDTGSTQPHFWQTASVGLLLIVVNPYSLMFWLSVGNTTLSTSPAALASFLMGCVLGCAIIVLIAGQLHIARIRQQIVWAWIGCAAVLLVFGVQLGYTTLATIGLF